jgi:serine phosphatase RsbU (regulator of sigma subunit)/anti-sigma regulatory factor (Ser/Thr protein kinase)
VLADAALALHGEPVVGRAVEWAAAAACDLTACDDAAYFPLRSEGLEGVRQPIHLTELRRRLESPMQRGLSVRIDDVAADPRFGVGAAATEKLGSLLASSVRGSSGTIYGFLFVGHPEPHHFETADEEAVQAVVAHLGVALDRHVMAAEHAAAQREIVHELQQAVLPPAPSVADVELGRHYVGAENAVSTGGDIYDWVVLPNGDLHVVIVDIMGKGVSATKDALAVTHALRMLALEGCPIQDLVTRAEPMVTALSPDLVATLLIGHYNPVTGRLRLAGAGHPPALIVRDGKAEEISAPGIPLGWPGAGSFEVVETTLGRDDTLILYTDGLIETRRDIIFGLHLLRQAAEETWRYPATSQARALVDRALEGAVRQDDSLALVLRRRVPPDTPVRPSAAPFEYRFTPHAATISLARNLLGDWLNLVPVPEQDSEDLILVASELCTNAVRHAAEGGRVVLRATADGTDVVLEVEDDGGDLATHPAAEPPDAEAEAGRGLFLVEALTDELETTSDGFHSLVRCRKKAVIAG